MKRLLQILLLLPLFALPLRAQLEVSASFTRSSYVLNEAIPLTFTIVNRSGRSIAFGEHDGHSWCELRISDIRGNNLDNGIDIRTDPFVIRNGEAREFEIIINDVANINAVGHYRARLDIYYPPSDDYFVVDRLRFTVRGAATLWEERIGLPASIAPETRHRNYALLRSTIGEDPVLYIRVSETDRDLVFACYPLGVYMGNSTPTTLLAPDGKVHILYRTNLNYYVYQTVDHVGNLVADRVIDAGQGTPRLTQEASGLVLYTGPPFLNDPENPQNQGQGNSITDRPEGLNFD